MSILTRRRLIAAVPGSGLAVGAGFAVAPARASAASSGTVQFVAPFRLTDSRINEPDKYETTARDNLAVDGPAGYCGVILNVTVTETEGRGFFRIADDFQEPAETSNVNWYADDQTVANSAIVSTASGITVQGGGSGRAHLIIDVMGFIV